MRTDLQAAIARWNRDVETEMVRLIEEGQPPYDAAEQARTIVENRRRGTRDRARFFERDAGGV